ncbi:MAG: acylphosphatase [Ruminococcus sp.]|nr:acylphosphatase [Ruminococcus sp.]
MEKIRRHIVFYGSVQGVGFRYRAYHAANRFGVTGYVKNLPDFSVEAELEGTEKDIDSVIIEIEKSPYITIERMKVEKLPLIGDRSFEIRD